MTTAPTRPPAPRTRERGTSGIQYAAALLVVAVIVAALTLGFVSSGLGAKVAQAVCAVFQEDCSTEEAPIDTFLPPCEVSNASAKISAEASAFSVNLGVNGKGTIAQVRKSDGSTEWTVTLSGGGHLGAHAMVGSGADFGLSKKLSASAKAALTASAGSTYTFDTEQEAHDFLAGMAKESAKWAAAQQAGLLGPAVKWILDQAMGKYSPPPASALWIEVGNKGSAELAAALGIKAKLSGAGSNALGIKMKPGNGDASPEYTVYYKGTRELAAQFGFGAEGSVETTIGVTYQDGKPIKASIDAAGAINISYFGGGKVGNEIPFAKGIKGTPNLGIEVTETTKGKVSLALDLTNADNMNALADVLQSGGMPILADHGTPGYQNPVEAMNNLAERFAQGGPREGATLTAQTFEGDTGGLTLGAWGGKILAFGASGGLELETLNATGGWFYEPGVGFSQWERCQ